MGHECRPFSQYPGPRRSATMNRRNRGERMVPKQTTVSAVSTADFAWLLGSLCQTHRIPWDPALALQLFPPPYFLVTLCEAAGQYGFRFGEAALESLDWTKATYPLIAFTHGEGALKPVIVAKADEGRILYFEPGSQEARTARIDELGRLFSPSLLLVAREAETPATPSSEGGTKALFGFGWFAREL